MKINHTEARPKLTYRGEGGGVGSRTGWSEAEDYVRNKTF